MKKAIAISGGLCLLIAVGAGAWLLWPTEVQQLTRRAENGDVAAQIELAAVLENPVAKGIKAEADIITSAYWLEQASKAGNIAAARKLLELYDTGKIESKGGADMQLLERMTELGDAPAAWDYYLRLKEVDHQRAREQLQKAAELGAEEAQYALALALEQESATSQEVYRWMNQAAKLGVAEAQYRMGIAHMEGPLREDTVKAQDWLLQAARQEHPQAMYLTGTAYLRSMATQRYAVGMLEKALNAGVKEAEIELARAYERVGRKDEGYAIYKKLALLGDKEAFGEIVKHHAVAKDQRVEAAVWNYIREGSNPVTDMHREFRNRLLSDREAVEAQWLVRKLELEARILQAAENQTEVTLTEVEERLDSADSFESYYSWTGESWAEAIENGNAETAWELAKEIEARSERSESLEDEVDWWMRLAGELGSTPAQLALWRQATEDSSSGDTTIAQLWLERAARTDPEAKYHLARTWLQGDLLNEAGAIRIARLLIESLNGGHGDAQAFLDELLFQQRAISKFDGDLLEYLESQSDEGQPVACYLLAVQKSTGLRQQKLSSTSALEDEEKAKESPLDEVMALLKSAADGGVVEAKTLMGRALLFPPRQAFALDRVPGINLQIEIRENKDNSEALSLLEEAAEAGEEEAIAIIEILRFHGKLFPLDPAEAALKLHSLAEGGYRPAQKLFSQLDPVAPDEIDADDASPEEEAKEIDHRISFQTAVEIYYEAHVKRNPEAMMLIGLKEWITAEFEDPLAERLRWLNEAARDEWPEAYMVLANMYWGGLYGVEQDRIRAFRWLTAAADLGDADAALAVGAGYARGEPLGRDEELALQYLKMSSDLGNPTATQLLRQLEQASGKKASEEQVKSLLAESRGTLEATPVKIMGFSDEVAGVLTGFSWGRPLLKLPGATEPIKGDKNAPFFITAADSFAEGMIRMKSLVHITPVMFLGNGLMYTGLSERIVGEIEPERDLRNCLAVLVVREGDMPEPNIQIYSAKLGNLRGGKVKKFTIKIPDNPYLNTNFAAFYVFSDGEEVMTNNRIQYTSLSKDRYIGHAEARLAHLKSAKEELQTSEAKLWDPETTLSLIAKKQTGPVRVRLSVTPIGVVREVELLDRAPNDESQRIIRSAAELLFLPAMKEGVPCDCEIELTFKLI